MATTASAHELPTPPDDYDPWLHWARDLDRTGGAHVEVHCDAGTLDACYGELGQDRCDEEDVGALPRCDFATQDESARKWHTRQCEIGQRLLKRRDARRMERCLAAVTTRHPFVDEDCYRHVLLASCRDPTAEDECSRRCARQPGWKDLCVATLSPLTAEGREAMRACAPSACILFPCARQLLFAGQTGPLKE